MLRRRSLIVVVLACLVLPGAAVGAVRPHALHDDAWRTWWGDVSVENGVYTLDSQVPTSPAETHSALITSAAGWGDQSFSFGATTLKQLRRGSPPNPWEVAWAMFRFRDLENYYYFILKPNGYELGKKQGSDAQIFLATGETPTLALGTRYQVLISAIGPRIRVFVNGTQIVDFTDPDPLASGSVGLYEEDSRVRFDSVAVAPL